MFISLNQTRHCFHHFTLWLLFCLLQLACFSMIVKGQSDLSVCHNLRTGRENILIVGVLSTRILLITDKYRVFELPPESLDSVTNKLHMSNVSLLSQKWPQLEQVLVNCSLAIVTREAQEEFILVRTKEAITFRYDIGRSSMTQIELNNNFNELTIAISSDQEMTFYSIITLGNSSSIVKYTFDGLLPKRNNITRVWSRSLQCIFGNTNQCTNIRSGFVAANQIYLFDANESVYNFDLSSFTHSSDKTFDIRKTSLKHFFECDNTVMFIEPNLSNLKLISPEAEGTSEANTGNLVETIVEATLGVIVLIALVVAILLCSSKYRICCSNTAKNDNSAKRSYKSYKQNQSKKSQKQSMR